MWQDRIQTYREKALALFLFFQNRQILETAIKSKS